MVPVVTYGWLLYGARAMHHHTNATKENRTMSEAAKVLDCLMMKRFFLQDQLLQKILVMDNFEIPCKEFLLMLGVGSYANIPQHFVQIFEDTHFMRDFNQRP